MKFRAILAGKLEEALEQYQKSKHFGVERAAMHIRNVSFVSTPFALYIASTG